MKDYSFEPASGKLIRVKDGTSIADFDARLKCVKKYITPKGIIRKYDIEFNNGVSKFEEEIDLKELEKYNYTELDDSLLLSPTVSSAAREMAYYITSQAKSADVKKEFMFDSLGWHCLLNKHYYCAGDIVISNEEAENCSVSDAISQKYHFEYDKSMTEVDAFCYSFDVKNIDPYATSLIFVSSIMGVMRQIIIDADIRIPCVVYVQGKSQSRKTTVTKLCACLYNRSTLNSDSSVNSMRVSSTAFKIEEISESLKDSNFILDDLYREQDNRLRKAYESHVRNIIRNFADNAPRNTARSAFAINCQIILTAEYLLKSKTDVGRMMLIQIDQPIHSERLAECQKNPLAMSTFYYFFIKWLSAHYDEIVSNLKEEYIRFRKGSFKHQSHFERLYEQFFLIDFVFGVYLDYGLSLGIKLDKDIQKDNFCAYARESFRKQDAILQDIEAGEVTEINFSKELLEMIKGGEISLGEKGSDCFMKGKFIYITNSLFGQKVSAKYKQTISANRISAYFRDRYISDVYKDNTDRKYGGKRYLTLNISELQKDAGSDSAMIANLFF